jgi:hypothetical protein
MLTRRQPKVKPLILVFPDALQSNPRSETKLPHKVARFLQEISDTANSVLPDHNPIRKEL